MPRRRRWKVPVSSKEKAAVMMTHGSIFHLLLGSVRVTRIVLFSGRGCAQSFRSSDHVSSLSLVNFFFFGSSNLSRLLCVYGMVMAMVMVMVMRQASGTGLVGLCAG